MKSTVVAQGVARIDLEAVVVPKDSVELINARVLQRAENVILMSAAIALSVVVMAFVELLRKKRKVITV